MDKKTSLYEEHASLGARIVPFAGYLMPLEYSGIIDEHQAVRQEMGMFDLSHMGEFRVTGPGALEAVDQLMTNDILGLGEGQVRYTPMCYEDAGIVDDLLVYRYPDHLILVVNASNIEKDLEWVRSHLPEGVRVEDQSDDMALIALQGPKAQAFLQRFTDVELDRIPYYHFVDGMVASVAATISRTGYTGEDGFELYLSRENAPPVWRTLLEAGRPEGLKPIGLGARDTLRLEAGYMLYGNDIDQSTSPLEAGLGWTVKFGEHDFVGRAELERQRAEGLRRRMVALEMLDRRIPRPHCAVFRNGEQVGELTSGTFSPTFKKGIGLGYLRTDSAKTGTDVEVEIRGDRFPGRLVRKPMYKREGA